MHNEPHQIDDVTKYRYTNVCVYVCALGKQRENLWYTWTEYSTHMHCMVHIQQTMDDSTHLNNKFWHKWWLVSARCVRCQTKIKWPIDNCEVQCRANTTSKCIKEKESEREKDSLKMRYDLNGRLVDYTKNFVDSWGMTKRTRNVPLETHKLLETRKKRFAREIFNAWINWKIWFIFSFYLNEFSENQQRNSLNDLRTSKVIWHSTQRNTI